MLNNLLNQNINPLKTTPPSLYPQGALKRTLAKGRDFIISPP